MCAFKCTNTTQSQYLFFLDPQNGFAAHTEALNLSLPRVALQRSNLWRSGGRRGRGRLPTRLALRRAWDAA